MHEKLSPTTTTNNSNHDLYNEPTVIASTAKATTNTITNQNSPEEKSTSNADMDLSAEEKQDVEQHNGDNGSTAAAAAATGEKNNNSKDNDSNSEKKIDGSVLDNGDSGETAPAAAQSTSDDAATSASPPPPIMKGTLSYDLESKKHLIRGMWNYENSTTFPSQRFELQRLLAENEEITTLPLNGEFYGSFSLVYVHTTSKGKRKERSRVIAESGVQVNFTLVEGKNEYTVDGKGTNQFGIFRLNGSAKPSDHGGDPTWNIILRKSYDPADAASVVTAPDTSKSSSIGAKTATILPEVNGDASGPAPPPSESFATGVVCLRGQVAKHETEALGVTEVVHKIKGLWSSGLNLILNDPDNRNGHLSKFEYDHKSSAPNTSFPVSGRYSGWFELSNEDGSRTRINERDVNLKFRMNSDGFYNVEGKGSNVFGKYTISGFLTNDKTITIFRHFVPRKTKSTKAVTLAPPPINVPQERRLSTIVPAESKLNLNDVTTPDEDTPESLAPPAHGTYSAVSRGILRVNDDGSHSCQGKWAVTCEHFNNGHVSNFNFRLEAHHAVEAASEAAENADESRHFPLDSNMYKGAFQLKKQGSKSQIIIDQQIVMKFRLNKQGSFNVYGKGNNAIGEFNLVGTMVMSGKTGGQVELFRMYPPEKLAAIPETAPAIAADSVHSAKLAVNTAMSPPPVMPGPPGIGIQRRESTRLVKLPSKLEEDDPSAQLARMMEKCSQILRIIREKDVELGAFFSEPVDPVALGIPTYHQIIKEPMDLKTIHRRMELNELDDAEEFSRLVRLVFKNAITFNVDPAHSVHQAALALLSQFNHKFRDVERMIETHKRVAGGDDKGKKKGKDDKKRRRDEPPKSLKKRRLEEVQAMVADNALAMSTVLSAAPSTSSGAVTRGEFTALFQMVQQLQQQVIQTYHALADLSPGDENDDPLGSPTSIAISPAAMSLNSPAMTSAGSALGSSSFTNEKKKKRKAEEMLDEPPPIVDESAPLTLDEQELLTETINQLPPGQQDGVVQIIRDSTSVGADEDEIDLEIDQLDHRTQRKLLKYVMKFVKKPKTKARKKVKTSNKQGKKTEKTKSATPVASAPVAATPTKKSSKSPTPKSRPAADSFFAFGSKGDSDSDSDEDDFNNKILEKNSSSKKSATVNEFSLSEGLSAFHDDNDDEDLDNDNLAATNWNLSATVAQSSKPEGGGVEDDAWDAAKEEAAAAKVREAERKAREKKMQEEAEALKAQRLQEAAVRSAELKAQRAEEEANEAKLKEQQEREADEARKKERERQREKIKSVEQTVDMDATRDIMRQFEQNFMEREQDLGNASPSEDYGF